MKKIIFALPGNEIIAQKIAQKMNIPIGEVSIRHFPDEETYVQVFIDQAMVFD